MAGRPFAIVRELFSPQRRKERKVIDFLTARPSVREFFATRKYHRYFSGKRLFFFALSVSLRLSWLAVRGEPELSLV